MIDRLELARRMRVARAAAGYRNATRAAAGAEIHPVVLRRYEQGTRCPSFLTMMELVERMNLDPRIIIPEWFDMPTDHTDPLKLATVLQRVLSARARRGRSRKLIELGIDAKRKRGRPTLSDLKRDIKLDSMGPDPYLNPEEIADSVTLEVKTSDSPANPDKEASP